MATEKKTSAEHWSPEDRKWYRENRAAVDRQLIFDLAKKLSELTDLGYTATGYYISDELLRVVRLSTGRTEFELFKRKGKK